MTDTNGKNGDNGSNGNKNEAEMPKEEDLDIEGGGLELEEGEEEEDDEPTVEEYLASLLTDAFDTGIPVRFLANVADPLVQPLLKRIDMSNAILADIAKSLRVATKRCEENAPFDTSIQIKKKQ